LTFSDRVLAFCTFICQRKLAQRSRQFKFPISKMLSWPWPYQLLDGTKK